MASVAEEVPVSPPRPKQVKAAIAASFSPVRAGILFFAAASCAEGLAIIVEAPLNPTPFAYLFFLSLAFRIHHSSRQHADATLWWPINWTLLGVATYDRFVHRPRGDFMKRMKAKAASKITVHVVSNPIQTMRLIRKAQRVLRWLTWGMPLVQILLGIKDHVTRYLIMRRQRIEKKKKKRALAMMRAKLDEHTSREEAAKRIQAAFRARKARLHVAKQKRSAQLRAQAAKNKLLKAAIKHRQRLQDQADNRPLLLRPDTKFMTWWKFCVLGIALLDVAQVMLAPEGFEKLSTAELMAMVRFDAECTPRMLPAGARKFGIFGPRALVRAPIPSHCSDSTVHALLQLAAFTLTTIISVIATCDVFVEYFVGVVSPLTGVLEPKRAIDRYIAPPFSLLFNVMVNPALASANACIGMLLAHDNPFLMLRLIITVQPVLEHAEVFIAARVRHFYRSRPLLFAQHRRKAEDIAKTDARLQLLAARSAVRWT